MIATSFKEGDEPTPDHMMEMSESEMNTSRHQSSHSSLSSEADLSFSLTVDRELDPLVIGDELPAFEIRLVSPLGRTPSPIDTDLEDLQTPTRVIQVDDDSTPCACSSLDFVTLQEINAQISPPTDDEKSKTSLSRCNSLETIFEGVFLNTPPRRESNARNINSMRGNLFDKLIANRLSAGKENQLPNGATALLNSPTKTRSNLENSKSSEDNSPPK
uniref:Uncharacterized protein n=1 Tax=Ceratitis capitata TaxID=7213 RepID=W8CD93_CERCA